MLNRTGGGFTEEDQLKQKIADHFKKEAEVVDDLVTKVNNIGNAS